MIRLDQNQWSDVLLFGENLENSLPINMEASKGASDYSIYEIRWLPAMLSNSISMKEQTLKTFLFIYRIEKGKCNLSRRKQHVFGWTNLNVYASDARSI